MSSTQNGIAATNGNSKEKVTTIKPKPIIKEVNTGFIITPDKSVPPPKVFESNESILDPYCDPKNPQKISFHDITSAAFLIKDGVERTPCPVIKKERRKTKFNGIIVTKSLF